MKKNTEENLYKIKAIVLMGILSATSIGIVSIYHLLWYNRPGDFYCAVASTGMIWPLLGLYNMLKVKE